MGSSPRRSRYRSSRGTGGRPSGLARFEARRGRRERSEHGSPVQIRDGPDGVDLVPPVLRVEDPCSEHDHPLPDLGDREVLPRHDLGHEGAALVGPRRKRAAATGWETPRTT